MSSCRRALRWLAPSRASRREIAWALPQAWPVEPRALLLVSPVTAAAVSLLESALALGEKVVIVSQFVKALDLSVVMNSLMFSCAAVPGLAKVLTNMLGFEICTCSSRKCQCWRLQRDL